MTHRHIRRLARFLDAVYGVLVLITVIFGLPIALAYLALFHGPPTD